MSGRKQFSQVTDEPSVENLLILTAVVLSSFSLALSPSIETSVLSEMNVSNRVTKDFILFNDKIKQAHCFLWYVYMWP